MNERVDGRVHIENQIYLVKFTINKYLQQKWNLETTCCLGVQNW